MISSNVADRKRIILIVRDMGRIAPDSGPMTMFSSLTALIAHNQ